MHNIFKYLPILICLLASTAKADLTINTPTTGTNTVSPCRDYFRYEWNQALDMSGRQNGPLDDIYNQSRAIDGFSYSNGILSFNTTSDGAPMNLLQYTALGPSNEKGAIPEGSRYGEAKPIDTSSYSKLVMRMYSSKQTVATVFWTMSILRYASSTFTVYPGWNIYEVDLASASLASSVGSSVTWTGANWEGFEIFPANAASVNIQVDWIQLTSPASCGSFTIQYNATTSGDDNRFALMLDNDTDYTNGVIESQSISVGGGGAGSVVINGSGSGTYSLHKLYPGDYYVYGIQSADWGTIEGLNPYDMSASDDIDLTLTSGVSNGTFSGGTYSGTISNNDPNISLQTRGNKYINGSTYRYLSVGITISGLSALNLFEVFFFGTSDNYLGKASVSNVTNGSQVFQIDMGGVSGWLGNQIKRLRIDPVADVPGATIALDFVALRSAGYVSSLSTPAIVQAPTLLKVANPYLSMIQPDRRGGKDFAQTVLGDSWNMNSSSDIDNLTNVSSASVLSHASLTDPDSNVIEGDFFRAYNIPGNGDPQYVPHYFDSAHLIDTSKYVNLCFKGWNATETNNFNSVIRWIWHDASAGGSSGYYDGDDIIGNTYNREYCLDLRSDLGTRIEPPLASGAPNPWTSLTAGVNLVRVDMNESTDSNYPSIIDAIHLRADHEAHTQFAIVVDAPLSTEVSLYYNSSASTSGGTLIGTLDDSRNTNVYIWDTTALNNGTYYVYGTVTVDGSTLPRLAGGRVIVDHSSTQDTTAPVLVCERPGSNSYTFDTSLELAGYALDETRLAALEVFIDGNYVQSITPDKFHLAARDAYAAYAESNNPGFQVFLDGTDYSYGTHTVGLVATDTAGNIANCEYSVMRASGQNTTAYIYPTPHNQEAAFDVSYIAPNLKSSVTVSKLVLKIKVTGLNSCGTLSIYGASASSMASPVLLESKTITTQSSVTFSTGKKKVRGFKDKKGKAFFQASCSQGGTPSSVRSITRTKVSSGKKPTTVAKWLADLATILK